MLPPLERKGPSEPWFLAAERYAVEHGLDVDAVRQRFTDAVAQRKSASSAAQYAIDETVTRMLPSKTSGG